MILIAGLLAASAAVPSWTAAASPVEDKVAVKAEDPITTFYGHLDAGRYAEALAVADQLKVDDSNKDGQAYIAAIRASALFALKRDREAQQLMESAEKLAPQLAEPSKMVFVAGVVTKRFDVAADAVDKIIAKYPAAAGDIDGDLMDFFLRNEPKGQEKRNDDRRIALAELGYGGDTDRGHYVAQRALGLLVKRGDFARASRFLPSVKDPVALETLLIQKRYAPLWPKAEEMAGPHLAKVRAEAVAAAKRAYDAAPDDHEALASYVDALRHAGRLSDAIALRAKVPATSDGMSSADEQMGWVVNNLAYAFYEAGRKGEGDSLLALLNDAPMAEDGWRISMLINRLELLVQDGQFDKALPLIEPTAKAKGSPYADQLVRRLRYCTMTRLGRTVEAGKYKAEMLAHAADAPGPTIDALLCGGDVAGAEKIALSALANPDTDKRLAFEEDFVRQLQPVMLTADDPSVWQGRWAELRKQPAIAAAFARLGRDMPEQFLPPKPTAAGQ
jgi:tetratricopeptide (TPR) repeat protein